MIGDHMLSPTEFLIGSVSEAAGLTLVLPRTGYEFLSIVSGAAETPKVVCLEGSHRFHSFPVKGNAWKGVLIPNIRIEVDESTAFDPAYETHLGALVRKGDRLCIVTIPANGFVYGHEETNLLEQLPAGTESLAAGFLRWMIVIGEGTTRRELKVIDARSDPGSA